MHQDDLGLAQFLDHAPHIIALVLEVDIAQGVVSESENSWSL